MPTASKHTQSILIKFAWSLFLDMARYWKKNMYVKNDFIAYTEQTIIAAISASYKCQFNENLWCIFAQQWCWFVHFSHNFSRDCASDNISVNTLLRLEREEKRRERGIEWKSMVFATHFRDCIRYRSRRCCYLFHEMFSRRIVILMQKLSEQFLVQQTTRLDFRFKIFWKERSGCGNWICFSQQPSLLSSFMNVSSSMYWRKISRLISRAFHSIEEFPSMDDRKRNKGKTNHHFHFIHYVCLLCTRVTFDER